MVDPDPRGPSPPMSDYGESAEDLEAMMMLDDVIARAAVQHRLAWD